jgi:hypothetical protein
LSKLLPAVIESTGERFGLFVRDFVGPNVSTLGKFLVADFTGIWFLPRMSAFMSLNQSQRALNVYRSSGKDG